MIAVCRMVDALEEARDTLDAIVAGDVAAPNGETFFASVTGGSCLPAAITTASASWTASSSPGAPTWSTSPASVNGARTPAGGRDPCCVRSSRASFSCSPPMVWRSSDLKTSDVPATPAAAAVERLIARALE
jgi:hypothetical protein